MLQGIPCFVDRAADYATPERTWKTEVKVFKGPTGCGKTRLAHELYPGIWTKPAGVWFDSTTDTLMSLLMTLREGGIVASASGTSFGSLTGTLWTSLLRGFKRWVPRVIVITTNVEPRDWYPGRTSRLWSDVLTRLDAGLIDEMLEFILP